VANRIQIGTVSITSRHDNARAYHRDPNAVML